MEHVLKLPAFINDSFDVFMRDLSAKNQTNNNKRPPSSIYYAGAGLCASIKKGFLSVLVRIFTARGPA
jgi:hypothetical protein